MKYNAKAVTKEDYATPVYQTEEQFSIDRNFSQYSYKFYTNFGHDSSLIIGIICYIQKNISKLKSDNLFGEYVFEYTDFMKFYNISKAYLLRKHPNPHFLEVNKITKEQVKEEQSFFTNMLGNALFLLYSKPFNEFYQNHSVVDKKTERLNERYIFFKTLEVGFVPTSKGRRQYKIIFSLNENVEINIFRYFDRVNKKVITDSKLRKNNLETLYLYLSNAKNVCRANKINRYEVKPEAGSGKSPFDFLSVIMQVDGIADFSDRKDRMNDKMKVLNTITGDIVLLNFEDSSTKKSTNQPYFTWQSYEPFTPEETQKMYRDSFNERYYMNLKKDWKLFHVEPINVLKKFSFVEWMKIETLDVKVKMDAYIRTYIELRGKKLDYNSEEIIMLFGSSEQKTEFQKKKFYGNALKA